jgi:alkyl sulfatase BDS1-like metallo-beta-lactamase superfamily hydrolase
MYAEPLLCQTRSMVTTPKPATHATRQANLPVDLGFDVADFDRSRRGMIAQHPTGVIESPLGGTVWDMERYAFITEGSPNPDTVHPSLWRQAQLNNVHGLFEVADGVWQARGYDISNITFIAGASGWIVIDPLTVAPCARAALDLANATLGERPVVAVIYTHSHADHFGGVLGVTTQDDVDSGRCVVIAPEHFMRETVGENVIAGYAMVRRAAYQFGPLLPAGPRQHVDSGLGKAIPFWGSDLIAPTVEITSTGEEMTVDGLRIVFQLAPGSEAPAEMQFFFPDRGWLCTAENCTHNMHNLVPIRGALVRDALQWSKYIAEMIEMFGADVSLMFASHHWPRWGRDNICAYLGLQRDLYRWMHDQTMRWANHGRTAAEIAETLQLPDEFRAESHTVGYYGHLVHNVKAIYQRYLSWYDGNPANLWRHPPTEAGQRYVALAGGADALLANARAAFDAGDYRWVAELVNHLVFADPSHLAARELQADALEQLGYQSESATFRNAYLTGAQELRGGSPPSRPAHKSGLLAAMSVEQIIDAMAVRLRAEDLAGTSIAANLIVSDVDEDWVVSISNRAMHGVRGRRHGLTSITLRRDTLFRLAEGIVSVEAALDDATMTLDGDRAIITTLFGSMDTFMNNFAIVEP